MEVGKSKSKTRYERYKHLFKAYYQRNKDKIREKQKAYREQNKEKIKEWQKREKYKTARERWFAEHKKETRAYQRKYYREVVKPKNEALAVREMDKIMGDITSNLEIIQDRIKKGYWIEPA